MIITIEGKQGEGKTTLANEICKGKKTVFITESSLKNSMWSAQIDRETEFLVVDEVILFSKTQHFFRKAIRKFSKTEKFPHVILINQTNNE